MKKLDLSGVADLFNVTSEQNAHDYRDEEGLLVCGMCGERKESRHTVLGMEKRLPIQCACERGVREREKAAEERLKMQQEADKARKRCFPFASMAEMTFENAEPSDALTKCEKYADRFENFEAVGGGLLLYGFVGTGKTYAAASIANRLIDNGYTALFTSLATLGNKMTAQRFDKADVLGEICGYDCVILDDLGIERTTPTMGENVYQIINALYLSGTVMIVTTNLDMKQIQGEQDPDRARIYSRLLDCCRPLEVKGSDRRKLRSREKAKLYDEVWR